jgi:hypothetical protein
VSARFQWIKGQVLDQCHLLESGQKPTIDGPPLMRLIRACEVGLVQVGIQLTRSA